jgi:hypothetical protein
MALDVYFREDVARILRTLAMSTDAQSPVYRLALKQVGEAFGVWMIPVERGNRDSMVEPQRAMVDLGSHHDPIQRR